MILRLSCLALAVCFSSTSAWAQFVQQGPKLIGSGAVQPSFQGSSVALSADGNTALVGGDLDNSKMGAAWVFTRSGGVWTQQGPKLVGTGAVGFPEQGFSVALSADGNTAIVGGPFDNSNTGAAWVFTRSGGIWTQQGPKLVGTGAAGAAFQGTVALSADGNTALIGGLGDNSNTGAAWVFTRSRGVWTQQGPKLVGTGAVGPAAQGISVSLSADGNTALVGGALDNSNAGATWAFTRSGGVWTQQGSKLVGSGAAGAAFQGASASLSGDGSTALIGGPSDFFSTGATWVFTRSGGVWTQQGGKLVGSGAPTSALQGYSVSLSGDGNTALWGGPADVSGTGAAWVFTRSGATWTQLGSKLVGTGGTGLPQSQGHSVSLSADARTAILGGNDDNATNGAAWVFAVTSDVGVTKTAPASAVAGANVTYTITVSDTGPSAATTPQWTDTLPAGATFVSLNQTSGPVFNCTTGATVTCSAPTLSTGASAQFSLTVNLAPSLPLGTTVSNTVTVTSGTSDPNGTNDSATASSVIASSIPAFSPSAFLMMIATLAAIGFFMARR